MSSARTVEGREDGGLRDSAHHVPKLTAILFISLIFAGLAQFAVAIRRTRSNNGGRLSNCLLARSLILLTAALSPAHFGKMDEASHYKGRRHCGMNGAVPS